MKTRVTMQAHVANYLAERRRLGYGSSRIGPAIAHFARYVDQLKHRGPLSIELMAQWAKGQCKKTEPAAWARRLLAHGSSLKEVADVLRHRSLNTSLIYAKLDSRKLAAVALPWPGSAT